MARLHLTDALGGVAADVFARYPTPPGAEEDFWEEGLRLVRSRLEETRAEAARPVRQVAEPMAGLIFRALPLHESIVTYDYDYIHNNLRMNLLRAYEDLTAALDTDALLADLLKEDGNAGRG